MPFKEFPRPSINTWGPDDDFDWAEDRLYVELNWHDDSLILAWSSDDDAGGLVIAHEAVPDNLLRWVYNMTDMRDHPTELMFFVRQSPDTNVLIIELIHPVYYGKFVTSGGVCNVRPLVGGEFYSDELAGHWRVEPGLRRHRVQA